MERLRRPFWFGASVALIPGLLSLPTVAFARGIFVGLFAGPVLQCLLAGAAAAGLAPVLGRARALASWARRRSIASLWLIAEALYFVSMIWAALGTLAAANLR